MTNLKHIYVSIINPESLQSYHDVDMNYMRLVVLVSISHYPIV